MSYRASVVVLITLTGRANKHRRQLAWMSWISFFFCFASSLFLRQFLHCPLPFALFFNPLSFFGLTFHHLVLQPAEEDWEGDLEGEWDLPHRYRHALNGEAARLQVWARLIKSYMQVHTSVSPLTVFLSQGLYEAGRGGWEKDWMYRQFTGEWQLVWDIACVLR